MAMEDAQRLLPCADDEHSPARPLVEYEDTPPPQGAGPAAAVTPEAGEKPAPVPGESPAAVAQVR